MGRTSPHRYLDTLSQAINEVFGVEVTFAVYSDAVSFLSGVPAVKDNAKDAFARLKDKFRAPDGGSLDDWFPDLQYDVYMNVQKPRDVPAHVFSPHDREGLGHKICKYVLKQIKTSFPPIQWLPLYQLGKLPLDIISGLTIGVLAVSQGLAYAALGGLPPYYGLYSFVVPVFTYALLSSSRRVSFGPTTIVMILTLQTLSPIANPDTQPALYLKLALDLAMLKGIWTTALGILRLGFVVDLLGAAVLSGFITAAGLVIASTQLRSFFGSAAPRTTDFIPSMIEWARALPTTNWPTFVLATVCLIVLIAIHIINDRLPIYIGGNRFPVPGPLLVTIFSTIACWAGNFGKYGIKLVGPIPPGLPAPTFPNFDNFSQLAIPSLIISIICYMETIAVARKEANERGFRINGNHELMAQGLANLFGSFTAAPPGTGSLSRTAVVMASGADSQIYQVVVGFVMIIVLLFVSPALAYTPYAALSAIVISAVYGLFEFSVVPRIWAIKKLDVFNWMLCFILTLTVSLEVGILAAWGVSLLIYVWEHSRNSVELLGEVGETEMYVERKRYGESMITPGISILRVNGPLFFGNANRIAPSFLKHAQKERSRILVLDMGAVTEIDYAASIYLEKALAALKAAQVIVIMGRVHGKLRDILGRTGLVNQIGEENIFIALPDAVRWAKVLLLDGQFESQQDVPLQFEETKVSLVHKKTCKQSLRACCCRNQQHAALQEEEEPLWTDASLVHVSYVGEVLNHDESHVVDLPLDADRGACLTENLHTFAHKQDPASVSREMLWWKM
jgi:SulP family sulfate permease